MSLRVLAEADLAHILEDGKSGPGHNITLARPDGLSADFIGASSDIGQLIDPDTGVAVSGRQATISLRMSTVLQKLYALPVGVTDSSSKPWVAMFADVLGQTHTFKIVEAMPDRSLGVINCTLELYKC